MSRAEARAVPPDQARAAQFLHAAERVFADAERTEMSSEGALILYYQACVAGMKAVLAAGGRDVGGGDDGHVVLIGEVGGLLGPVFDELLARIGEDRRERNAVSYAAVVPSALAVETVRQDARELLDAASRFVRAND